jgi:hypothetical protein
VLSSAAHAGSQRFVDARALDIADVKTGMDYDQALAAAANHFHVAPGQIKSDPFPGENIVTHTKLPAYFTYEKDGVKLTVHFEGRVPVDKAHPLVAWLIDYELPWTQQNSAEMARAAVAKYGKQSNAPNNLPMQWCANPSPNPGMGCSIGQQATLELSQVSMKLTDPAWQNARIKFVHDSQHTKPNF